MAFFRKRFPSTGYKYKFKLNKPVRKARAWVLTPTKKRALLVVGTDALKKTRVARFLRKRKKAWLSRLSRHSPVTQARRVRLKQRARKLKLKRLYEKWLAYNLHKSPWQPAMRAKQRSILYGRGRLPAFDSWKGVAAYFFPKPKRRVRISKKISQRAKKLVRPQWSFVTVKHFQPRFKKHAAAKRAMQHFRVPVKQYSRLFRQYYSRRVLTRWQGAFVLAVLSGTKHGSQFFKNYQVDHLHRRDKAVRTQMAYEKRQRKRAGATAAALVKVFHTARGKKKKKISFLKG